MVLIDGAEIRDTLKLERVGVHSHIRGLGLSPTLEPTRIADGMVAQVCYFMSQQLVLYIDTKRKGVIVRSSHLWNSVQTLYLYLSQTTSSNDAVG